MRVTSLTLVRNVRRPVKVFRSRPWRPWASGPKMPRRVAPVPRSPYCHLSPAPPFGINGIGHMHYWNAPDARLTAARRQSLLKRIGARSDRALVEVVEPEQGRFDWRAGDSMFDLYRQSEIQPLTILSYASAWSNGVAPARDEEADRFAVYAEATVRRYRHVCAPGKSGTSPTSRRSGSRSQTRVTTLVQKKSYLVKR